MAHTSSPPSWLSQRALDLARGRFLPSNRQLSIRTLPSAYANSPTPTSRLVRSDDTNLSATSKRRCFLQVGVCTKEARVLRRG
jgi:hypothetical protein